MVKKSNWLSELRGNAGFGALGVAAFTFFFLFVLKKIAPLWHRPFPSASIGESGVVAYAQYYGYPQLSDTALMLTWLAIPFLTLPIWLFIVWWCKPLFETKLVKKLQSFRLRLPEVSVPLSQAFTARLPLVVAALPWFYLLYLWTRTTFATPPFWILPVFVGMLVSGYVSYRQTKSRQLLPSWLSSWLLLATILTLLAQVLHFTPLVIISSASSLLLIFLWVKIVNAKLTLPTWFSSWLVVLSASQAYFWSYITNNCTAQLSIQFDSQNFLTWDYTSSMGWLPYKDIFYLYGHLLYFRFNSILTQTAYLFAVGLFVSLLYFFARSVLKNWLAEFISLLTVVYVIGVGEYFIVGRYGWSTCAAIVAALTWSKWGSKWWYSLVLGISAGLLFGVIPDQGVYSLLAFGGLTSFQALASAWVTITEFTSLKEASQKSLSLTVSTVVSLLRKLLLLVLGTALGLVPFLLILISTGSFDGFVRFLGLLQGMNEYAKFPMVPLFTFGTMQWVIFSQVVAMITVVWGVIWRPRKLSGPPMLGLIAGLLVVTLLQYKNSIRPHIANQITFTTFFVWIGCIAFWQEEITNNIIKKAFPLFVIGSLLLLGYKHNWKSWLFPIPEILSFHYSADLPSKLSNTVYQEELDACVAQTFKPEHFKLENDYSQVLTWVSQQRSGDAAIPSIFSYPGDPIFYVLLGQKPISVFNAYDATPLKVQKQLISELDAQKTQFVLLNTKENSIQDGVPDLIRNNTLMDYITQNYKPVHEVGRFIVLEKAEAAVPVQDSLLFSPYLDTNPTYKQMWHETAFQAVACGEALKLKPNTTATNKLASGSLQDLNAYLQTNPTESDRMGLLISFNQAPTQVSYRLVFGTSLDEQVATAAASFTKCGKRTEYILSLDRLPLFFSKQQLDSISAQAFDADQATFSLLRLQENQW